MENAMRGHVSGRQGRSFEFMRRGDTWLVASVLIGACFSVAAAQDVLVSPQQRYQLALEAQSARDYGAMLGHLRQAAREGEPEAQAMLSMALLTGPMFYGDTVPLDRCEALYWARKAAASDNAAARQQLDFLNRTRMAPSGQDECVMRRARLK